MTVITFGRSSQNNVIVSDSSVSRVHCQIVQYDNGNFSIIDFGSTNGTFINGRRITGTVSLNWNDSVQIGNTRLQWQQHFSQYKKKTDNTLGLVLGLVGGVIVIALILIFAFSGLFKSNNKNSEWKRSDGNVRTNVPGVKNSRISIDGTNLDFNMSLDEIKRENPNANIEKKHVKGYSNEISSVESYDYYLINSTTAIILNTTCIDRICTWSKNYKTSKQISIGCTWGEVVKAYPNVEFWILYEWYDYFSYSYEMCFYIYDPVACTGFVFKGSQFSETQRSGIYEVFGGSDSDMQFFVQSLSSSVYQSICSSVMVEQIVLRNCGNNTETKQQPETYNMKDIDANTTEIAEPSGNTTKYTRNELIGTEWEHFHNNASSGDKTTEISFIDDNSIVIRNFPPPARVRISTSDAQQLAKIKRVDAKYYYDSNIGTGHYITTAGEKVSFIKNSNTITFNVGSDVFIFYRKSQYQTPKTDKIQKSISNTYTILGIGKGSITYPDGKKVDYVSYKGTQYIYLTIYDNNVGTYKIGKVTATSSKGNYTATFKDYVHDLSGNFIGYQYQGGYQDFSINNWIITITKK
ncbi:MAG: FHA domain-containing protein [Prevotellaceae bacterium]|jgi:hypothetical protein|nr:FHA domain-containing protein [Prevotellaceae bacterium]